MPEFDWKERCPFSFQECHLLVMLPDGILQSRSEPAMSDNVKINVFWYLHTEVLIRRARRLRLARNLPLCDDSYHKAESSE